MTIGIVLGVVVLLAALSVVAAVLYRLVIVRRNSTSAVVRRSGEEMWRYGAVRYSDTEASFYRLLSVRFGADVRLDRRSVQLGPSRQPTGAELDIAEAGESIVPFSGSDRRGRPVRGELCLGPAARTALRAWVEAAPPADVRRRDRRH